MRADLQDEARTGMLGIVTLDLPEDVERGRHRIRWPREHGHHRVANGLDDRAIVLLRRRT